MRHWPHLVGALAVVAACVAVLTSPAGGASSNVVVSMDVISATNLSTTGCATGSAGVTDFGTVLPGTPARTQTSCTVGFGSSNDTSMLRLYQTDGVGRAMWRQPSGVFDDTFDGDSGTSNGIVSVDMGGNDSAFAAAPMPDGRIVVAGVSGTDLAVARFLADGTLDTTFNGTGKVVTDLGATDVANDVKVQPDGKVVVAGKTNSLGVDHVVVVRYTSAGALDTTFDGDSGSGNGVVIVNNHAGGDSASDLELLSDGRIVVSGSRNTGWDMLVNRLLADGKLDTTFNGSGTQYVDYGGTETGTELAIQSDGKVLVGGRSDYNALNGYDDFAVARLTQSGQLDPTWGGDGMVQHDYLGSPGYVNRLADMTIAPDGDVMLSGHYVGFAFWTSVQVMRLNGSDGSPDTSFSGDGMASYKLTAGGFESGNFVSVSPADGTILITGSAGDAGAYPATADVFALRLLPNGNFDTTFDQDGVKVFDVGAYESSVGPAALVGDGEFVMALAPSNTGGSNDRFSIVKFSTGKLADYADTTSDWDTGSSGMFGVCMTGLANGATVAGTWVTDACPMSDGAFWKSIPTNSTAPDAKVAQQTTATATTGSASFAFGVRTPSALSPGRYYAPVTFEVLAPNA